MPNERRQRICCKLCRAGFACGCRRKKESREVKRRLRLFQSKYVGAKGNWDPERLMWKSRVADAALRMAVISDPSGRDQVFSGGHRFGEGCSTDRKRRGTWARRLAAYDAFQLSHKNVVTGWQRGGGRPRAGGVTIFCGFFQGAPTTPSKRSCAPMMTPRYDILGGHPGWASRVM